MESIEKVLGQYQKWLRSLGNSMRYRQARADAGDVLRSLFPLPPPSELLELYSICDGWDVVAENGDVEREIPSVDGLKALFSDARWFSETHPDLASRFFPITYIDGDSVGYLVSGGKYARGLWLFCHEDYRFDENQASEDFLFMAYKGIGDYLKDVMTS